MSVQDYVGMQSLMRDNSHAWGKGAGIWAIAIVIIMQNININFAKYEKAFPTPSVAISGYLSNLVIESHIFLKKGIFTTLNSSFCSIYLSSLLILLSTYIGLTLNITSSLTCTFFPVMSTET